jgi:hypothetical protein
MGVIWSVNYIDPDDFKPSPFIPDASTSSAAKKVQQAEFSAFLNFESGRPGKISYRTVHGCISLLIDRTRRAASCHSQLTECPHLHSYILGLFYFCPFCKPISIFAPRSRQGVWWRARESVRRTDFMDAETSSA